MPLASDRQVNEKPFEIGMNSQNSPRFDPLDREKTEKSLKHGDWAPWLKANAEVLVARFN
jgi:hypothetical protein